MLCAGLPLLGRPNARFHSHLWFASFCLISSFSKRMCRHLKVISRTRPFFVFSVLSAKEMRARIDFNPTLKKADGIFKASMRNRTKMLVPPGTFVVYSAWFLFSFGITQEFSKQCLLRVTIALTEVSWPLTMHPVPFVPAPHYEIKPPHFGGFSLEIEFDDGTDGASALQGFAPPELTEAQQRAQYDDEPVRLLINIIFPPRSPPSINLILPFDCVFRCTLPSPHSVGFARVAKCSTAAAPREVCPCQYVSVPPRCSRIVD